MDPYNATVRMYRMLFGVGLAPFVVAVTLSIWTRGHLCPRLRRPDRYLVHHLLPDPALRSLEENLNFITWLGVIYNSLLGVSWVYATNPETIPEI